jgi:DNA-binding IscR family transcriptional regulator
VNPAKLTLARVIGPFDTLVERRACLLGRPTCSDHSACAAHQAWKATAEQVLHFFRTTTVADIGGSDTEIAMIAAGVRGRAGRPAARGARA